MDTPLGQVRELTAAEAGLNTKRQVDIALKAIIENSGTATSSQIYDEIERNMPSGTKLSQQGRDSARRVVNQNAVDLGYVEPHDSARPGWRITPEGRGYFEMTHAATSEPEEEAKNETKDPQFEVRLAAVERAIARSGRPEVRAIYDASETFVRAALRNDDSIFTPGRAIWSLTNLESLYERYVGRQDISNASFVDKLQGQLEGVSPDVIQLMVEMLFVHFLKPGGSLATDNPTCKRDTRGGQTVEFRPEILGM